MKTIKQIRQELAHSPAGQGGRMKTIKQIRQELAEAGKPMVRLRPCLYTDDTALRIIKGLHLDCPPKVSIAVFAKIREAT